MSEFNFIQIINFFRDDWVVSLFLLGFIWFFSRKIFYYIVSKLKGDITIHLDKRNFKYGDTISGKFHLRTRKEIESEGLSLDLICLKMQQNQMSDTSEIKWVEHTRISQNIEGIGTLDAGIDRDYAIQLKIPSREHFFGNPKVLEEQFGMIGNNFIASMAQTILKQTQKQKFKWRVSVHLEAKGIDIISSESISIIEVDRFDQ